MVLEAVFLDVGGTLLREEPSRAEIYAQVARARGETVVEEEMRRFMYRAHDELPLSVPGGYRYSDAWFRLFIERIFHGELGWAEEALPALQEELFARFSDASTFRLLPAALETLEGLSGRGLRVGVISNWGERLVPLLEGLGVAPRVDFVLCSALEGVEKPDPAIFRRALARAGTTAERAVHMGNDPEKDARAAQTAGLEGILIDHGESSTPWEGPRLHHLLELLDWIDEARA